MTISDIRIILRRLVAQVSPQVVRNELIESRNVLQRCKANTNSPDDDLVFWLGQTVKYIHLLDKYIANPQGEIFPIHELIRMEIDIDSLT
jgi:hypothetical protein